MTGQIPLDISSSNQKVKILTFTALPLSEMNAYRGLVISIRPEGGGGWEREDFGSVTAKFT